MDLEFPSWVDDLAALDPVWTDTLHDELEQYPEWIWDDEGFHEYHPDERPVLFEDRILGELTERIADLEVRRQALDAESVRLQAQVHVLRLRQYRAETPEPSDDPDGLVVGSVEIDAHEAAVRDLVPALRLSHRATSTRLHDARRLVGEHPAVLAAYAAGTLTWAQRQSTREHLDVLTHRADVRPSCTNAQLNRRLAGQVLGELPGHEPAAVQRRERGRRTFTPCQDGVSTHVGATVDTGLALLLQHHLTACADEAADHSARTGTPTLAAREPEGRTCSPTWCGGSCATGPPPAQTRSHRWSPSWTSGPVSWSSSRSWATRARAGGGPTAPPPARPST